MAPTAPTASGSDRRSARLVLTVTRDCDLRCSYCPTVKRADPSLSVDDALRALRLFAERWGGGEVKLFGGEPLLRPSVVEAVLDAAANIPSIRRVLLSTNGLALDEAWLDRLAAEPKALLLVSIDGALDRQRRHRRRADGEQADWERLWALIPRLAAAPRAVVTMTIPPAAAAGAADDFEHLRGLGLRRFNLLPGYLLRWSPAQLAGLRASFERIGAAFVAGWDRGERLYLRNLFTWSPVPFFNVGLVVDCDGAIHPANVGLVDGFDALRGRTKVGSLDDPPSPSAVAEAARAVPDLLASGLPPDLWAGTLAADAELTRLCRSLLPSWAAWRARGRSPAA
jgi:pyruvate-formate lyase-activating enzyme